MANTNCKDTDIFSEDEDVDVEMPQTPPPAQAAANNEQLQNAAAAPLPSLKEVMDQQKESIRQDKIQKQLRLERQKEMQKLARINNKGKKSAANKSLSTSTGSEKQLTLKEVFAIQTQNHRQEESTRASDSGNKRSANTGNSPKTQKKVVLGLPTESTADDLEPQLWVELSSSSGSSMANSPPPVVSNTNTEASNMATAATNGANSKIALKSTETANKSVHNTADTTPLNMQGIKPPPLFLPNVADIMPVLHSINTAIGEENYITKPTAGKGLRVLCNDIASYRKLVKYFQENDIVSHTYQLKNERGFRVVIRHLHHTTPTTWIRSQLADLGHNVRFLSVIKKRFSREPMDLFEVEIEVKDNNSDILLLTALCNQIIKVERPLRTVDAVQCHRCQQFGHTKNYCRRPFVCVKCSDSHPSTACDKTHEQLPKCVNCSGPHAASYKGCKSFKDACKKRESVGFQRANKLLAELSQSILPQRQQRRHDQLNQPAAHTQQQRSGQSHPQVPPTTTFNTNTPSTSYAAALRTGIQDAQQQLQHKNQKFHNQQPMQQRQRLSRSQFSNIPQQQQHQLVNSNSHQSNFNQLQQQARSRSLSTRRTHANQNSDINRKLDTLINILLEDRNSTATARSPNQSANSNLEGKLDKLITMITTLTTCLLAKENSNNNIN